MRRSKVGIETPLLNADAGFSVWKVTRRTTARPATFERLTPREAGLRSAGDLPGLGFGEQEQCRSGAWRLFLQRDLDALRQTIAITCANPATVILCEGAMALRATLKRLKAHEELPVGFNALRREARELVKGWSS